MPKSLNIDLSKERSRRTPKVHRWWARRGDSTSVLSLLLTNAPELAFQKDELELISLDPASYKGTDFAGIKVLDLCCGSCEVSAAAARLGAKTVAIDLHPIPILIGNAELLYPARYGEVSQLAKGIGKGGKWAGLRNELDHWANELIARAKKTASRYWLEGIKSIICQKAYKCESCLSIGPIRKRMENATGSFSFQGQDNDLLCLSCGSMLKGGTISPYAYGLSVNADDQNRSNLHDFCNDSIPFQHELVGKSGSTMRWASWGLGWLSYEEAVSPRQAIIQASFKSAYRSIRDDLADLGYDPQGAKALLTYLALSISNKIDLLSTSCHQDTKTGRIKGIPSLYWRRSGSYCEIGGDELAKALRQQFALIQDVIEANTGLGQKVTVANADMRCTNREPASFDLILWDPPYYDNLSYDVVAYPWTRFLRELLGDIDSSLVWPNETAEDNLRDSFSEGLHAIDLEKTLNEIARIIKPGGKVGVFWLLESDQQSNRLAQLLEIANGCGLELIQTFSLAVEARTKKTPQGILLVLRPSIVAPHSANASIVTEGTIEGKKMMHAGIVEILLANLPEDEIEDLIPSGYKGSREQRLSEAVLSSSNPRDLLMNVPKSRLLSCIKEKDLKDQDDPGLNKEEIANMLMELLGWTLPRRAEFTIGAAIDEIKRLRDELKLTKDEREIRGVGAAAFDRIEQILRFCVVSWSTLLREDRWILIPGEITGKRQKFSFGDWYRCVIELPAKYSHESVLIERARVLLKKSKITQALEPVVSLRNCFSHHDAARGNWHELRDELIEKLGFASDSLWSAYEMNAFPLVLQPDREIRDQYGRITLRLTGHRGRPIEFLMTQHSQMSSPIVVIPSNTNPREVDPCHLMAADVFSRAAI